jgi:exosortase/archaeosortase family protein
MSHARVAPDFVSHLAERFERLPPLIWPLGVALVMWPQIAWMARRMFQSLASGTEDSLGILAFAALLLVALRHHRRFRSASDANPGETGWLAAALLFTVLATLSWRGLPPLFCSLLAFLAFASCLIAFLPRNIASLPLLILAALSLPLLQSLQFYAGFPLRVVVAEASRWILALAWQVEREGVALWVDGRLVLVDAACSGVQLVWLGNFTACVTALLRGYDNHAFLRRLPLVGFLILIGNIVRNTVLVALEASGELPRWAHEGIGLLVLAMVCAAIMSCGRQSSPVLWTATFPCMKPFTFNATSRLKGCLALALLSCLAWNASGSRDPYLFSVSPASAREGGVEWPAAWQGRPLRPLALTDAERRFGEGFPGRIVRLTDGENVFVWRHVTMPTRMLHPATDCYRAMGWRIRDEHLEESGGKQRWRCFTAQSARTGERLRVCERIEDRAGQGFTDTSAWYWSALLDSSRGPWQAMTIASPLGPEASM